MSSMLTGKFGIVGYGIDPSAVEARVERAQQRLDAVRARRAKALRRAEAAERAAKETAIAEEATRLQQDARLHRRERDGFDERVFASAGADDQNGGGKRHEGFRF